MRFRPFGNGILNAMVIGRDINVVAGFATLVAHYTYAGNLYSVNYFISGAIGLVMGGVLTMVGGNTINSNLMQVQLGWCCQLGTCKWSVCAMLIPCDWCCVRFQPTLPAQHQCRRRRDGDDRLGLHVDQRAPVPSERRTVRHE